MGKMCDNIGMKARIAVVAAVVALACGAWTKHYSFRGGYPVGVQSGAAAARENGGASVSAGAASKQRTRVVRAEKTLAGRVTKVVDGDTVVVTPNGGRGTKVRLNRIDAPEADQPGGDKATAFLKDLVGGKQVEVKYAAHDDYGRVLGTIYFKSEKGLVDANLTMILNGWAWHYHSFKANDKIPAYAKAEQAARAAKVGLWAAENPIRPYDWRKSHKK